MKSFSQLRIIFLGTPDFAVASLNALIQAGGNVVAVVTAPDKPSGRGLLVHQSPVKIIALSHNIPILQPVKLKSEEFIVALKTFQADLQVVVAFRMLPEVIWNMPPIGTINVHASLLPQYRGAAPINWAIINGEKETGVTTFLLKQDIDTGDILLQQAVPINDTDNAETLHDKLMIAGADLLIKTINELTNVTINEIPQSTLESKELKHAPKIFRQDLQINWSKPVLEIQNLIRGLSPYPAAHTLLGDKTIKIFKSHYLSENHNEPCGSYQVINSLHSKTVDVLRFAAKDGWIYVEELQQEGKKRLDIVSFLRGFRQ